MMNLTTKAQKTSSRFLEQQTKVPTLIQISNLIKKKTKSSRRFRIG